jgi:Grx4 family monothiol glutaredoxin
MTDDLKTRIDELVHKNQVLLFMKGTPQFPQCGFSAQVVAILNQLVKGYATVNVLADPQIREGIKEYSEWPTIPQLYIAGQFIGGCDIVKSLYGSGELHQLLGVAAPAAPTSNAAGPPRVRSLSPRELKTMLEQKAPIQLFDVRTDAERAIARIEGARQLDPATQEYVMGLDRKTPLVFHCHHGMRSRDAAQYFLSKGFHEVYNLEGGIDAWSQTVDPSVRRY